MKDHKLIVIAGPTAVGKTAVAIRLAEHLRTEILSADSRQIFRELEIGTAKPSLEELSRITHHFINSHSIEEEYDAGSYGRDATAKLDKLFETSDKVVMCGGSGLYIKAVTDGFDDVPDVPATTRTDIVAKYQEMGLGWLQEEVARHDPDYFEQVDRQNPQRLMRALEVIRTTGRPFSGFHKKKSAEPPFEVLKIGLECDREELYRRIDSRMDKMIEEGLFEEAEKFFPRRKLNALQTVGYQEIFGFLEGKYDRHEAIRLLKRNSRHYAKRQLTWFKKDKEFHWFHPEDWKNILILAES